MGRAVGGRTCRAAGSLFRVGWALVAGDAVDSASAAGIGRGVAGENAVCAAAAGAVGESAEGSRSGRETGGVGADGADFASGGDAVVIRAAAAVVSSADRRSERYLSHTCVPAAAGRTG